MSNEKDQPNDNVKEQALERALSLARVLTIGGDQDSINVPRSFPAGPGLLKTVPVISLILIFPPRFKGFNSLRSGTRCALSVRSMPECIQRLRSCRRQMAPVTSAAAL